MLDVTEGTISKYEANTMTPPFETLRSIAGIFNVSMDTLCGMKHQGTLSTHGLTEAQTDTLKALVDAYRRSSLRCWEKSQLNLQNKAEGNANNPSALLLD